MVLPVISTVELGINCQSSASVDLPFRDGPEMESASLAERKVLAERFIDRPYQRWALLEVICIEKHHISSFC